MLPAAWLVHFGLLGSDIFNAKSKISRLLMVATLLFFRAARHQQEVKHSRAENDPLRP